MRRHRQPTFTVILPVMPGAFPPLALRSIEETDYPKKLLEILIAAGNEPSAQRNLAADSASGDILYFLDDDSEADIDLFHFAARSFRDPDVAIVGGPSEILRGGNALQRSIGYVLGSYFATANIRCRYRAIGRREQKGTEQNLILCNMAVRRDLFIAEGGFDERLYPNEENEFLNRMTMRGYKAIYNPKMAVSRPHRSSLRRFMRQMFRYGRGRAEHIMLQPAFINPLYLLPMAFIIYLLTLPITTILAGGSVVLLLYGLPLLLYAQGIAVTTLRILAEERDWPSVLIAPLLFPLVHVSYGLGMVWGLIKPLVTTHRANGKGPSKQLVKPRVWQLKALGGTDPVAASVSSWTRTDIGIEEAMPESLPQL